MSGGQKLAAGKLLTDLDVFCFLLSMAVPLKGLSPAYRDHVKWFARCGGDMIRDRSTHSVSSLQSISLQTIFVEGMLVNGQFMPDKNGTFLLEQYVLIAVSFLQ